MPEQIVAQIAGDGDEYVARDVTREPPQQIVGSDERDQDPERGPYLANIVPPEARERIDQQPHAILRADGTTHGSEHRGGDQRVRERPHPHVVSEERKRPVGKARQIAH